jgi:hypothetical protein
LKTQIIKVKVSDLIKADWNYKTDGTDEQIQTLMNAINKAGSAGVFAVREIETDGKNFLEVMDGNHRLDAIKRLEWKEITVENFGPLSLADAVIVTRQRNQNWFDDDKLKLANLYESYVFTEYDMATLASFLPDTQEALETMKMLANSEYEPPDGDQGSEGTGQGEGNEKKIFLKIPEETFNLWMKWKERLKEEAGIDDDGRSFEYAVIEALNTPEGRYS